MRYLRMYVVINLLMTGVMRAAEASFAPAGATADMEGVPAGVDEEPPQQTAAAVAEQPQAVGDAASQAQEGAAEQPTMQEQKQEEQKKRKPFATN